MIADTVAFADFLRTIALFLGGSVLVTDLVLYWRIIRFSVPPLASRAVLGSASIITLFAMLEIWDHLGQPLTWRAPIIFTALVIHEIGLISYYIWTRRPDGRKQRHAMRAEHEARRLLIKEGQKP